MANSSMTNTISKVVEQAREKYDDLMQSEYIGINMKIDGQQTKGQYEDNKRSSTEKERYSKTATCMLDVKIKRGSYIEMQSDTDDKEYSQKGVVYSMPIKTPVDYYFTALLFNTTVQRRRKQLIYAENGDIIDDISDNVDEIPCFVQRIGQRQRQLDVGIDRDSVNQIITIKGWDIQKNDIIYIGSDKYKINDIEELDRDIFTGYMTYYRE